MLRDLRKTVRLIADTARRRDFAGDEAQTLLAVLGEYDRALGLLDDYGDQRVSKPRLAAAAPYVLGYESGRSPATSRYRTG